MSLVEISNLIIRLGFSAAGIIVGSDGLPVLLRGITWPGFDTGTMVSSLQVKSLQVVNLFIIPCLFCIVVQKGSREGSFSGDNP